MLTNALKSTSVLALCAAMMAPPAIGQSSQGEGAGLEACDVMGPFPCVLEDGTVIEDAAALARWKLTAGEGQEEPAAEAPPAVEEAPADAPAEGEAAAEDKSLLDTVIEETGEAVEDLLGVDPEAGDPVPAEDPQATQPPADVPIADEAPAPDQPSVEPQPPAEVQPADEPKAEDVPAVEAPAEEAPVVEAPAEDKPTQEPPADAHPADDSDAAVEQGTGDTPEAGTTAPQPRPDATPETGLETMDELPAAAAAAADAEAEASGDPEAAMDAGGDANVTVEEVTEEAARSSSEEFDTKVGAENRAPEARSGMSDFERALLIGLGAVAVGAILYNGAKVVSNSGDRIVVRRPDGTLEVLKNDDETLRRPGSEVVTRTFDDGSVRTVVTQPDGTRIITIRAANGTALKRTRVLPDGSSYVLFDDTIESRPVDRVVIADRPAPRETLSADDEGALRAALMASMNADIGRSFSLRQIRQFEQVRDLAPLIEVDAITFDTGSAVIKPTQAEQLAGLGIAIREVIKEVPGAVFLVEGHTDAVGDASYNLALSDRRAESVALALTEYFNVPPENLITQGYGESELKILTNEAERRNRRANVRNITPLLR